MGKEQSPFVLTEYVTAEQLVKHYGVATLGDLPTLQQQRYVDYALNSNREISSFLYKWVDALPLPTTGAAFQYASGMAFKYAQRLKQIDDGAINAEPFANLYLEDKEVIAKQLMARPENLNKRRIVSNGYPDEVIPYSQSYGLSDIL